MRSLIVEDEPEIAAFVARLLGELNGVADIVGTLADAQHALRSFSYDLAVVDRMLPDGDALEIVSLLSEITDRPAIILLTARDAKDDVIDGLDSGADDYLAKPFDPQEFLARTRAVLRRPRTLLPRSFECGNVALKVGTNEALVAGQPILLRRREALILETLLLRRDRVVSRGMLVEALYGFDEEIESNSLEAQVSRLRKKISDLDGNVEIRSIRGIGYILRKA